MFRTIGLIASMLFSTHSFAAQISCEAAYRNAYSSSWSHDAKEIYNLYTDAEVGVEEAYIEGMPLFDALNVLTRSEQREVLAQVVWMMKSGGLCKTDGTPMTLSEAAVAIKAKR